MAVNPFQNPQQFMQNAASAASFIGMGRFDPPEVPGEANFLPDVSAGIAVISRAAGIAIGGEAGAALSQFGFQFTGVNEFERTLVELEADAPEMMRQSLHEQAQPVIEMAAELAPKETGLLAESIGVRTIAYGESGTAVAVIGPRADIEGVGPDGDRRIPVMYANLIEFGTEHIPAQPFMRPAFDQAMTGTMHGLALDVSQRISVSERARIRSGMTAEGVEGAEVEFGVEAAPVAF